MRESQGDKFRRDHQWLSRFVAYDSWSAVMGGLPFISIDWLPLNGLRLSTIGPDMTPVSIECWPQNETDVVKSLAHLIQRGSWHWTGTEGEAVY